MTRHCLWTEQSCMKQSYYNYIISDNEYTYWYNGLTNKFFRLSYGLSRKVQSMMDDYPDGSSLPDVLREHLINSGFLIDDGFDELTEIRRRHRENVESRNYSIVLMPTLDCNYRCWYCIQDHLTGSKMSLSTLEKLKRHIDYMIKKENIESLYIDWFGGEPLMYFNEIVEPVTVYALQQCHKAGIPFGVSATTNGFYLDSETVVRCGNLGFRQFQITLDGNKENHDKVKYNSSCVSTFDHVLSNIDRVIDFIPDVNMILRINYTHDNISKDIVAQVNRHIKISNRKAVLISPHKVWQESVDKSFETVMAGILEEFSKSGYRIQSWNPSQGFIPCYTNRKYYNAINYNGNVMKCTACDDLHKPDGPGRLPEDGSVEWKDDTAVRYTEPTFENPKCLACKELPVCMGLCPREHVMGRDYCKHTVSDTTLQTSLINHLRNVYKTTS